MVRTALISIFVVGVAGLGIWWYHSMNTAPTASVRVESFEACVAAGHAVIDTFPRLCQTPAGETFFEETLPISDIPASEPTGQEMLSEIEVTGVVALVDLEQMMVDGPGLITLSLDGGMEQVVVAVPSMGLPLCAAFANIEEYSDLAAGDVVSVYGSLTSEGHVVPCNSPAHYLRRGE